MNDAVRVGSIESICDLNTEIEHCFDVQRLPGELVLEGHAFEILNRDERLAFMLPNLVDGADIRVIDRRSSTRLPPKTIQCLRVVRETFRKKLQGCVAT